MKKLLKATGVFLLITGCSTPAPRPAPTEPPAPHVVERGDGVTRGLASWYGRKRLQGRRTASGERFDRHALTAAHRTLPFGTIVEVRELRTGRMVRVRINCRGPTSHKRVIDLSYAAAKQLGMLGAGVAQVEIRVAPAST